MNKKQDSAYYDTCFDGVVRKSGNSLVITIPYNVVKSHKIQQGTSLEVCVLKLGEMEETG